MSKITFEPNASGTGVFTIASPNSNTDRTLNLPDKAGTINVGEGINDNATSTAVTIDSSGNVGIGTASPAYNLTVNETATSGTDHEITRWSTASGGIFGLLVDDLSSGNPLWTFRAATNEELAFKIGASEAMRIDSSGNLLVGKTASNFGTAGVQLQSNGELYVTRSGGGPVSLNRLSSDGGILFFAKDGTTVGNISVTSSSTSYNTSSDYRLKENVVTLDNATDRLKQIPVHRFNFIADADTTVDGFLAHEVQAVVPEAIHGVKDEVDDEGNPVYQGIDQSKLVPLLVATVKELEARIATLEAN